MKILTTWVAALLFLVAPGETWAQFGPSGGGGGMGGPKGPNLSGAMAKLFGENTGFSASIEMSTKFGNGPEPMVMPGKIAYLDGKSRFEMDLTQAKGTPMRPEQAAQMKAMGMGEMIVISRPDKKISCLVYPGLQSHVEMPLQEADLPGDLAKFKIETTELGKETLDGRSCVKNKVVVTDDQGRKHESTVWNATDLKNFPVKIESIQNGTPVTMSFREVKLAKPDAALFEAPANSTKYADMMQMMREGMMKKLGGGGLPQPPK
jgi:hypothetical protein